MNSSYDFAKLMIDKYIDKNKIDYGKDSVAYIYHTVKDYLSNDDKDLSEDNIRDLVAEIYEHSITGRIEYDNLLLKLYDKHICRYIE